MKKYLLRCTLLFITALQLFSCKGVDQSTAEQRTPLDLAEVDALVSSFPIQDPTLNIVFDDSSFADVSSSGTGTLGKCLIETNTITIDERFWVGSTRLVKESLLYHEMAHCLLGIGHHSMTIMDSFIGYGAKMYKANGLSELGSLPCDTGCDLPRIQNNRASFNANF